ncbi:MAG: CHAD domain-containing protein [Thiovulaceae bacterium]|nr:CHAD domain-containing protein [Sulfurimonadaceae bacterium]
MKFKNIFQDKIELALKLYKYLCVNYDVEDLHKYRVSLRKMLAYNQVFGVHLDEKNSQIVSKLLKDIIRPTSLLRDLDLFLVEIDVMRCSTQSKKKLLQIFTSKRDLLVDNFKDDAYKKNLQKLKVLTKKNELFEGDFHKLDKITILQNMSKKISKHFNLIDENSSFEELHKQRIKFKRFRYALEMYMHYFSDEDLHLENFYDLKKLQDIFGVIQDNSARIVFLEDVRHEFETHEIENLLSDLNQKIKNAKQELFRIVG